MEKSNTNHTIINTNDFILCPNCNCYFPQIHKLIIRDKQFNVCITCDNCSDLHHGKYYNIETLLNSSNNTHNSVNHNKQKCWICDSKNETISKLFCITCEKWICNDCMKHHDEWIVNDIHSYVDKHKHIHSFCDKEIYFKHKCSIHHNIKPIDRTLEKVVTNGNFKSIVALENNADDEVTPQTPGKPTAYNSVMTMDVPRNESANNNYNKSYTIPRNDMSFTSTNDNSNVIYDDKHNIIANKEGNVYADKYCAKCNLFFCESCAIDHENIMEHTFDNEIAYNREDNINVIENIIKMKETFIAALSQEIINLKEQSSSSSNNKSSALTQSEFINLNHALQLNQQHHNNYLRLLMKISHLYDIMKLHNMFNLNIINSFIKLFETNNIDTLCNSIKKATKYFQTFNIFLLTKFYFKTEPVSCFKNHTIYHNGVTSMLFFKERLYTGGKRMLKKWRLPYTNNSSSTLLKTKDGSLTGRLNCFCKVSENLILAGSEKGNILLCEFGEHSGIRITSTDRQQPILCMQLLNNDLRESNHVTSFLLSDTKGIWEISIESRNGKTLLSEVEFFKTRDEHGRNVPVRALITAKGASSCFLLGGLDYIYPKFRGNTLIKIQDSIKCSERNEHKLISCMTYVEGTSILVVGSYDNCVGALVLHNPQQKSKYKEITSFNSGVVSVVSNKENEVIALSAGGTFKVINLTTCFEGKGFQWEVIASFQSDNFPTINLVFLQEGYFAICGCDKIEIWYTHI